MPDETLLSARHELDPIDRGRAWLAHSGNQSVLWRKHKLEPRGQEGARRLLERIAVVADLDEALVGLPHLFLKGPTLSVQLYGEPGRRSFTDIDVLVGQSQFGKAVSALEGLGFKAVPGYDWRLAAVRSATNALPMQRGGLLVELHWHTESRRQAMSRTIEEWPAVEEVEVGPRKVKTPTGPVYFHYLVMHGAKDHWRRLLWLTDVVAWWEKHPQDVEAAWRVAQETRTTRAFRLGLSLAGEFTTRPVPAFLVLDRSLSTWRGRILASWLDSREFPFNRRTDIAYHWAVRDSLRDRWRYLQSRVLAPTPQEAPFLRSRFPALAWLVRPIRAVGKALRPRRP